MIVGVAAVMLMGQGMPRGRTLEAERFVVKDSNGKVRAILGESESPSKSDLDYGLFLYTNDGKKIGAKFVVTKYSDGGFIWLNSHNPEKGGVVLLGSDDV